MYKDRKGGGKKANVFPALQMESMRQKPPLNIWIYSPHQDR
jgi:hypothetical protein